MTDNMKKWLEFASQNEEVKSELTKWSQQDRTKEEAKKKAIEVAGRNGFTLTEEDFASAESEELSDDELDAVAGGGGCGCPAVGYGKGNDTEEKHVTYSCFCFIGGGGVTDDGDDRPKCMCPAIGGGADSGDCYLRV